MTRRRGELPELEEDILGIERPTPEEEAEAERIEREKAELRRMKLTGWMGDPDFRRWLMEHLVNFGTFGSTFAASPGGFPDRDATMYYNGRKEAGWDIWAEIDGIVPELASVMRREWKAKTE